MSLPPVESRTPMASCTDEKFLELLQQLGIEPRAQDGKLRISAPPGVVDDELKAELVRRKQALLAKLTGSKNIGQPITDSLYAPLSYAQERLWLLERFQPGNYAYNIPEISQLHAPIDRSLMQRAIDAVVERHAVLRTSIVEDEHGNPLQQIQPQISVPLEFIDLRHGEAKEGPLKEVLRAFARQPFDLRQAPLARFCLVQLEDEKHVIGINIHHIISDRWSMRILNRELLAAYQAFANGNPPEWKPLPIHYADYALRERTDNAPRLQEQLRYWQQQLASLPDPLELPFRSKPAVTKHDASPFDGAISLLEFTQEDTAAIRALARANGATLYMLMLAADAALLSRFTGASDLLIGSPVSERTTTDTEALIGVFVNTLVMRCAVPEQVTFRDLLRNIRETVLDAQANHAIPLQRILSELHLEGGQPPFQTVLAFDSYMGAKSGDGDSETQVSFDPGFAKFELTLQMYEERDRIGGWFEYRTDLFTADAIARLSNAFVLLLRDAVRDPSSKVAKLAIISGAERQRLLRSWNATAMDFPRDQTIHRLFEEQVDRTPDATAIVEGMNRIDYRTLNRMANRVAHGLLASGVTADSVVGVHMERSTGMIAAMLGILKAGGAYLPLDPTYPADRLRTMIEDSACVCALSDTDAALSGQTRILSPAFHEFEEGLLDHNPSADVAPANLAYVIFTSGSTGRPKGVAIEHHSAVSFLQHCKNTYPPEVLQGTLAATSISFDLSVFEILLPLITGHKLILASDVLSFPSLPAASEVTLVATVPSAAAALLATGNIPDTVRTIVLGGEVLSTRLVDRLYAETKVSDVIDIYGPTETTTYSISNRRSLRTPPTIGRPIGNTRIYLVDRALEPVPEGVPGEVVIAGEGVARGYIGRPDLTAERFISLEHLGETARAYRTGDLCRYQPDGVIEYLGRMDNQVKVRGFRIEVAEVESALSHHPSVEEAAVVAQTEEDAGATLVAAVVLKKDASLDVQSLIAHQAHTLPPHMVARKIFAVDALPRTASGKLDRRRLSLPSASAASKPIAGPRDPLEKELVSIWQQGFHITSLGIDDDFFELGGQSLLALRIFTEIEAKLGCRMMLSVLFQAPTIRQLAEYMRHERLVK